MLPLTTFRNVPLSCLQMTWMSCELRKSVQIESRVVRNVWRRTQLTIFSSASEGASDRGNHSNLMHHSYQFMVDRLMFLQPDDLHSSVTHSLVRLLSLIEHWVTRITTGVLVLPILHYRFPQVLVVPHLFPLFVSMRSEPFRVAAANFPIRR